MEDEKIKALVNHILEECEKRGFTEKEVLRLSSELSCKVDSILIRKRKTTPFTMG